MLKTPLKYSLIILFLFVGLIGYNQSTNVDKEAIRNKQRVNYIYNFTKYIDWEGLDERSQFVIGVLGAEEYNLVNEFKITAKKRLIKGLPVTIKSFSKIEDITNVDILYLNKTYNFDLNPILSELYVDHGLLVTEGYPFHMSMINFIELDDEFHFEINQEKINRAHLLVAPELLSFSTQSTADWNQLYKRLKKEINKVKAQKVELVKLSSEIEVQKQEIKVQQNKLNQTLDEIKIQSELLSNQKEVIKGQNSEIKNQIGNLWTLANRIDVQRAANFQLQSISKEQAIGIERQNLQIKRQKNTLSIQLDDIQKQTERIEKQGGKLNLQLTQIGQQRILLMVFIVFALFSIFFSIFMYRANKRRKESERILQIKHNELIEVNKSLDSFTYRVSHDLKAPVLNMKNMILLLEKYTDQSSNEILPELFKNLDLSANRLENTIAGMLELTKIERIHELKSKANIFDIVNGLLPEYQEELNSIGARVNTLDMSFNTVFGSETELTSIFQNLITNSIKYRSRDKLLAIEIKTEHRSNQCIISYADNGIGIDLLKFEGKLFNIFQRFTTDNSISGSGIGMHIIKKLVEKNNGSINLKSKPNHGLTYFISLPSKEA